MLCLVERTAYPVCVFVANTAARGGAFYSDSTELFNNVFTNNTATSGGGGAVAINKLPSTIQNCVFVGNTCTNGTDSKYNGGAALRNGWAIGCEFRGNATPDNGGAYYGYVSGNVVSNCIFGANSATNYGVAYNATMFGCLATGNSSSTEGGVLVGGGGTRINCTFVGNLANEGAVTDEASVNCLCANLGVESHQPDIAPCGRHGLS
jgi:predicted outer membrane repeat protein